MTNSLRDKQFNNALQFIYEHMISVTVLASIILYLVWNFTRYLFTYLTESQEAVAITLQELLNSILITIIIVFFVISIQRREFSYFEHLSLVSNGIIKTTKYPHTILYANQQLLDLLNYSEDEILNQDIKSLYSQDEQLKLDSFIKNSSMRSIKNVALDLSTKNGKTIPVLLSISRVYSMFSKKEKGLFIVVNDIKKFRESQKQVENLMQVEKDSVINSFVQKVGHEINNPLTFMMYDSERLIEYVREMIGMLKIYDEVEKKLKIESEKSDILENMDKIEQMKLDMHYETAISDLEDILTATKEGINRIAKVVKEVRTYPIRASEKYRQSLNNILKLTIGVVKNSYLKDDSSIIIESDLDINVPQIPLKASEIAQIFLNMLINSIQAIEEIRDSGKIVIKTKVLKNKQNDIDSNPIVEVCIEDNGIGIKDDVLPKIFDQYFTTKQDGTGLGLSNVKKVIQDHNGSIDIYTEYMKGTKIKISLPAY